MILVGLTGSIGSGKSSVSTMLRKQPKIGVIDADEISHKILKPGMPAYYAVIRKFGSSILATEDSKQTVHKNNPLIDRRKLAKLVFEDNPELIYTLNNLTHPWIIFDCINEFLKYFILGKACCILDATLIVEGNLYKYLNKIVVVKAPYDTIIERLRRRNPDDQAIIKRLKFQAPQEEKVALADYLLDNSGPLEVLQDQVALILPFLIRSSTSNTILWFFGLIPAVVTLVVLLLLKNVLFLYYSMTWKKGVV